MRWGLVVLFACGCRIGYDAVGGGSECSDGIDNDLDSAIDFPDDPGCSDAEDSDESSGVVPEPCDVPVTDIGTDGLAIGNTSAGSNLTSGTCGGEDAPEVTFRVTLDSLARGFVTATEDPGTDFNTILYVRDDCAVESSEIECDDLDGADDRSMIHGGFLDRGSVFVTVDGKTSTDQGPFAGRFEVLVGEGGACHPELGLFRCEPDLSCLPGPGPEATCQPDCPIDHVETDSFTLTDSNAGGTNVHGGTCTSDGGIRAPEIAVQLTLTSAASDVVISTDNPGTDFDTVLYFRDSCDGPDLECNDDSGSGAASRVTTGPLAAGDYFIFVDGFARRTGNFELTVDVTP